MFRFTALLALLAVVSASSLNAEAQSFDPNKKMDGATSYNAGRMAELPQGANRLQLWVVLSPQFRSSQLEDRTARWFTGGPNYAAADARLEKIKQGCAWNYYFSNSPLFAESGLIQAVGTATPIVCLTKANGEVVTYINANTMSRLGTPGELADLLMAGIEQANPAPHFDGQSMATAFVREAPAACPDGQCPPTQPVLVTPPRVDGTLTEVVPSSGGWSNDGKLIAFAAVVVIVLIAIAIGESRRNRQKAAWAIF